MAKEKPITKNQKYRWAIRKTRSWFNKTRKRKHQAILGEVSKEENVIKYFFKEYAIPYESGNKKELQKRLLEVYIEGHEIFKEKLPVKKRRLSKEEKTKRNFDKYWSDPFFGSEDWQKLRKIVLKTYGKKCMKCSTTKKVMHVDHIKPRSKYPHLQFDFNNLQVLCCDCNEEKSNKDETDYRNITINITNNFYN
jgi:5-methylcytosine-specific restriction endonuclease McrA